MPHLNYKHLRYFWTVASEGSIQRASEALHITPQTISGQLKLLEQAVGQALFQREGRRLVLTETGHLVKRYADDIFALGGELAQVVRQGSPDAPQVLQVGIVDSIAKLIAYRILRPALSGGHPVRLVCEEGGLEALVADLAVHRLDLVISDRPLPPGLSVRLFNHVLGDSPIAFFCRAREAAHYRGDFPRSLHQAPLLMPARDTGLRRDLESWLRRMDVEPRIVAEFDDSALLKAFGLAGAGIFPAPAAITPEIEHMYHARQIGLAEGVSESYRVISAERRLRHPAVLGIFQRARDELFASEPAPG